MDAAQRGVKRHLPDRNAHTSRPLIAQAEDSFTVADYNAFHIVVAGVIKDLGDTVSIRVAEKKSSRLSPDLTESLTALADGWGVDEGQHLFHVANYQGVEQGFVRILQITKESVLAERSRLPIQGMHPARDLFVEGAHMRWQQSMQVKHIAFLLRECCSFVEARRVDQIEPRKGNLKSLLIRDFM
jgi:hypothetical protein